MGNGARQNGEVQTFYPNYVTMGLIQIVGCAVLFFAFFLWFIETRSPSAEIREMLFRGFLLRLGQTQLSLMLVLVAGTWLGRVRIGAAGLQSIDAWGLPVYISWDDVHHLEPHSLMGFRCVRIFLHTGHRFLSLPISVFHCQRMIDTIKTFAPPGNPLREYWNT